MVMAESERASGSLATSGTDSTPAARLQWLKQRREALQEKLARKNNELKNLCIDEAELTGVLPPEIPLDPGESPPIFRRRVGTSFTYPQNLINKLKTNQQESALELECQVQAGIAAAAFAIVNDLSESKAVRRKHRLIYQQSQRCLKDLESRLNFIRQGYGQLSRSSAASSTDSWPLGHDIDETSLEGTSKYHKTKKPRPPLDSQSLDDAKSIDKKPWTETEITSTSTGHLNDWHRTKSRYVKHPEWHSTLPSGNSIDQNDNFDVYEHQRLRTYSHGNWEDSQGVPLRGVKPSHQLDDRPYRKISDTYALDAENRSHWQQKNLMEPPKYAVYHNQRHHIDSLQYKQQQQLKSRPPQLYYQEPPLNHREKSSPDVPVLRGDVPNGFPQYRHPPRVSHVPIDNQRHQEELIAKRMSEGMKNRGRKSSENSTWCVEEGGWYPGENYGQQKENFGSLDRRKHSSLIRESGIPHNQHRLEHLPPPPPPPPPPPHTRMLLRTQSLGSVEHPNNWPGTSGNINLSPRDHQNHEKEKEWYETSMDGGYQQPPVQRHYPRSSPSPSSVSSSPKLMPPTSPMPPPSPSFNEIPSRISQSTEKDLEIPAESSNHTPKYQPYREVTKPFEMSDFYKYSTKFRKKNEGVGAAQRVDQSKGVNNNNMSYANNNCAEEIHQVPQNYGQRRAYEGQLMGRSLPRKNESNNREWSSNSEDCRVPPNDSTVV